MKHSVYTETKDPKLWTLLKGKTYVGRPDDIHLEFWHEIQRLNRMIDRMQELLPFDPKNNSKFC